MKEHPQGQSVQQDAEDEHDRVDGWEHQLRYPCVSGARLRPIEALDRCGVHGCQCPLSQITTHTKGNKHFIIFGVLCLKAVF